MPTGIHAFVMAGGCGSRLQPLTDGLCKPALAFGADHRVVDFVLANLRNSGVTTVDLLVQYRPEPLIEHVRRRWTRRADAANPFAVRIARPPERPVGRLGPAGYRGTADAVFQNLSRAPWGDDDLVAVFGADHVYRMDLRRMVRHHLAHKADVSVAALPVPLAEASGFGVVETDARGRAIAFHEKPQLPVGMPGRPTHALASMGNYLFRAPVLRAALSECCAAGAYDFGHHVLPLLLRRCHVQAYDFRSHAVAAAGDGEEPGYWRDVGTLDAYFEAQMDILGPSPRFALDNPRWPLAPRDADPQPALVMGGDTRCSRLGSGAVIDRASLDHAVVGAGARVLVDAQLSRCVLFDGVTVGSGARLRNVIVAEGNAVPANARIGYDIERDRERFPVSNGGIVVVPPGHFGAGRSERVERRERLAEPPLRARG